MAILAPGEEQLSQARWHYLLVLAHWMDALRYISLMMMTIAKEITIVPGWLWVPFTIDDAWVCCCNFR